MIFDVKREDFFRKTCLVAGGHITETPDTITYAIVIFLENVCLALVTSELNYLEVKCGDVMNAYIT